MSVTHDYNNMKGFIYQIINTKTTDIYIGSTTQPIKNRFKTHKSNARIGKTEKLYDHMRTHGIEFFTVGLLEEFEISSKSDLGIKEKEYYEKLKPSLNMKTPSVSTDKKYGKIYCVSFTKDNTKFYIGSTIKNINSRLGEHRHASTKWTTPFYTFMKEQGKENFEIECLEDAIPIDQLITRENYWISELNPPLNKNTNLCMTDKDRDHLRYIKNKEKRLVQVNERRLIKRDEINTQKMEHYQANKDQINQKDKDKRKELREKEVVLYDQNPLFTKETLEQYNMFRLKEIAKRFGMKVSPKIKSSLIEKILDKQKIQFTS